MRILTEFVGGVVLLMIFAYGVRETIRFFNELYAKQEREMNGKISEPGAGIQSDAEPPTGSGGPKLN